MLCITITRQSSPLAPFLLETFMQWNCRSDNPFPKSFCFPQLRLLNLQMNRLFGTSRKTPKPTLNDAIASVCYLCRPACLRWTTNRLTYRPISAQMPSRSRSVNWMPSLRGTGIKWKRWGKGLPRYINIIVWKSAAALAWNGWLTFIFWQKAVQQKALRILKQRKL